MNTIEKLDKLAEFHAQRDLMNLEKQRLLKEAIPAEVQARLDEVDAEFSGKTQAVSENIAALEEEVKAEVLAAGETVKGAYFMAVYTKGRVTWDSKSLDGYVKAHPELAEFRKEGSPSISLRKV